MSIYKKHTNDISGELTGDEFSHFILCDAIVVQNRKRKTLIIYKLNY